MLSNKKQREEELTVTFNYNSYKDVDTYLKHRWSPNVTFGDIVLEFL